MQEYTVKSLLKFNGIWRSYQQRVLDRAEPYLQDGKVHIVAAPGSGKTTLGIELIRRLGEPALILAPSINIRNQWIARIKEAFLPEGMDTAGILSCSLGEPALITAVTYQAFYSAMTGTVEEETESGEKTEPEGKTERTKARENVNCFQTLCLDEAHHLRSEWWRTLETFRKNKPELAMISLTATPPYDAPRKEWDRYIELCGPIDEEIIVPELIKEGSLCPHQDYVYFNMPSGEETQAVIAFRENADRIAEQLFADDVFAAKIASHTGLKNPELYGEQLLEKPEYLSSLIVFLHARKMPFPQSLVRLLGAGEDIPEISLRCMELILQGFLYEDCESFDCDEAYRDEVKALLKSHGLIQKNKVILFSNDGIDKMLISSKGKIRSIVRIVEEEYKSLGDELRLLVLTDYIKKEYLSALGEESKPVNELGVIPIFENIRRECGAMDLRLAALSGSVVLIPEAARELLETIMAQRNIRGSMKACAAAGYYELTVNDSEETAVLLVTEAFKRGAVRVLIGTKSLLGEGWDSPCINSLILASFVGSFVLSNQMRGRAIRTMKENPHKVSNIWHLICMEPAGRLKGLFQNPEESEDFAALKRRFQGFLGVHYEKNSIENGLERLSCIKPPYTKENLENINRQMLAMAADRESLKKRWQNSLTVLKKMDVAVEAGIPVKALKPGIHLVNTLVVWLLYAAAAVFCLFGLTGISILNSGRQQNIFINLILIILLLVLTGKFFRLGGKLLGMATPFRYLRSIGKGVLKALQESGMITSRGVRLQVEEEEGLAGYLYLEEGTEREKDVFAQCIMEFFGEVDNQRYLLKANKGGPKLCRYFCVPEVFGKRKEDAQLFAGCIGKYMGPCELIYTRNEAGRKELLEARISSFANKSSRCMNKRKKIKSLWE